MEPHVTIATRELAWIGTDTAARELAWIRGVHATMRDAATRSPGRLSAIVGQLDEASCVATRDAGHMAAEAPGLAAPDRREARMPLRSHVPRSRQ
jgi:hypothetical protein